MLPSILNNYLVKPIISKSYIGFAAPFLFFRTLTPFKADEPNYYKVAEGSIFTAIAAGVQYCVINGYLKSYTYSYLPIVFSTSYHNNILGSEYKLVKFVGASVVTVAVKVAIDFDNIISLIPPLATYSALEINKVLPKEQILGLAALTSIIDNLLKLDNHYASWSVVGGAITHNLVDHYIPSLKFYSVPIGMALGLVAANYEKQLVDQLASPSHFNNSYNILAKFIDKTELNQFFESHYITTANMQIAIGFFGNFLLLKAQERINLFSNIQPNDQAKFDKFLATSFKYILVASGYTIIRTANDVVINYKNQESVQFIQSEWLNNHVLAKNNFILMSKTNHSIPMYLEDLEIIINKNNQMIQWSLFGVGKLSNVGSLNTVAYASLAGVMISDYALNIVWQYLTILTQEYSRAKDLCESKFSKINEHDKEYAITILQKNGLDYTSQRWKEVHSCLYDNTIKKNIVTTIHTTFKDFYNEHILCSGLHMVVGFMNYKGVISAVELFLYTRTLQTLNEAILFKSKNQASFAEINTSIERLEELHEYLYSQNNTITNVQYNIDEEQDSLLIQDLEFTRGNKEQVSRLFIEKLELVKGASCKTPIMLNNFLFYTKILAIL